ncbi:DUF3040 domain-containing protein [Actinospica robiniae]|nr:DUF3040 domain-containing protein [Actinospica robiniae]
MLSAREEQILSLIEQQLVFESPRWALRFDKLKKRSRKNKRAKDAEEAS